LKHPRAGLSATVGLLVVVLIVAAAFYIEIPRVSTTSSTSTSTGSSSTSTASSSQSTGGSTGTLTISSPQPLIVAPNQAESVSLSLSAIGTVSGNYTFSASSLPSGVSASFQPSSVTLPSGLHGLITMTLTAASGATVVNSTMNVVATAGSSKYTAPFSIESVQALVIIQGNAFHPSSLTVPVGTKVYWLDLDPSSSPDLGSDMHDVTAADGSFSSGTGALGQYAMYGHTFSAAGTVSYKSAAQPSMTGQIIVSG
jgi:plastocyanin